MPKLTPAQYKQNPFYQFRHPALTAVQKQAFDLLAPYFPQEHHSQEMPSGLLQGVAGQFVCVNLAERYSDSPLGTALCNYNLEPVQARGAVDAIEQMDCSAECLFICPIPVPGAITTLPAGMINTGMSLYQVRKNLQVELDACLQAWPAKSFPPAFSVHMCGAGSRQKDECVNTFATIALACLLDADSGFGKIQGTKEARTESAGLFKRIGIRDASK